MNQQRPAPKPQRHSEPHSHDNHAVHYRQPRTITPPPSVSNRRSVPPTHGRNVPPAPNRKTSSTPRRNAPSAPRRNTPTAPSRNTPSSTNRGVPPVLRGGVPSVPNQRFSSALCEGVAAVSNRNLPFASNKIVIAVIIVIIVALLAGAVHALTGPETKGPAKESGIEAAAGEQAAAANNRVSFVAVGDNLPDDQIGAWADAQAGTVDDNDYDYRGLYTHIKPYIQKADLAYIDQETHIGGDEYGPRGYPSFNTTTQMADAVVDTGFDLVASATNHSYDWGGVYGCTEYSRKVWNAKDVLFTGTAANEEEAATIPTTTVNGISFAFLNYTYGVNGYERGDIPDYAVNFIDKERITADVTKAHEMADVVLVAMHWGTENYMDIDEFQAEYAQLLADLKVDVVMGSHPHVIGPMDWVQGKDGNKTLVAYSLGNFISRHETPAPTNELEGMLNCDFVKKGDTVSIENVTWTPLINHRDDEGFAVYPLPDYTNELASKHPTLSSLDDACAWAYTTSQKTIGDDFTVVH